MRFHNTVENRLDGKTERRWNGFHAAFGNQLDRDSEIQLLWTRPCITGCLETLSANKLAKHARSFRRNDIHGKRPLLSLLSFLCLSLSFFFSLFSVDSSTGVDTLSLSTADDSIKESRARQVGKERVSRQFRPSFIRFIPRVVKYPAAGWWDSKGNSVFGKYLNRGSGVGEAFSSSPRRALHYHDL